MSTEDEIAELRREVADLRARTVVLVADGYFDRSTAALANFDMGDHLRRKLEREVVTKVVEAITWQEGPDFDPGTRRVRASIRVLMPTAADAQALTAAASERKG